MKLFTTIFVASSLTLSTPTVFASGTDAEAVVAAVKKANPDLRVLCQKGPEGIRKAVTEATTALAVAGKLAGDPATAGGEAGQQIGKECRGG